MDHYDLMRGTDSQGTACPWNITRPGRIKRDILQIIRQTGGSQKSQLLVVLQNLFISCVQRVWGDNGVLNLRHESRDVVVMAHVIRRGWNVVWFHYHVFVIAVPWFCGIERGTIYEIAFCKWYRKPILCAELTPNTSAKLSIDQSVWAAFRLIP